jgi:predicted metalloprotease with PDZ domain
VEHRIVLVGTGNFGFEELVLDTARLAERTIEIFGDIPYGEYIFFMEMAQRGDGGLEHRSTALCSGSARASRATMKDSSSGGPGVSRPGSTSTRWGVPSGASR